jgi:hypothetical protein
MDFFAFAKKYQDIFKNATSQDVNEAWKLELDARNIALDELRLKQSAPEPGNDFVTRRWGVESCTAKSFDMSFDVNFFSSYRLFARRY